MRARMRLYVVRDLQDGATLFVSDKREAAEQELTYFLGTHSKTDDGDELPTLPVLECYSVRIGRLLSTADAETVSHRVDMRQVREQAKSDQIDALFRDMMAAKGGAE